jgi:BMFP domain-containing protein YqiC
MKSVAQAAREQQIKLERRLHEIEARLGIAAAAPATADEPQATAPHSHDDLSKPD